MLTCRRPRVAKSRHLCLSRAHSSRTHVRNCCAEQKLAIESVLAPLPQVRLSSIVCVSIAAAYSSLIIAKILNRIGMAISGCLFSQHYEFYFGDDFDLRFPFGTEFLDAGPVVNQLVFVAGFCLYPCAKRRVRKSLELSQTLTILLISGM